MQQPVKADNEDAAGKKIRIVVNSSGFDTEEKGNYEKCFLCYHGKTVRGSQNTHLTQHNRTAPHQDYNHNKSGQVHQWKVNRVKKT